jgi:hypothetical protein
MPFTPTVAANYAANWRPVGKVPGYEGVKSDFVAKELMALPALQFAAEMNLVQEALGAKADLIERKMINENVMDQLEFQQAAQNKANKRALAAKLLSGGAGSKGIKAKDPRAEQLLDEQYNDALRSYQTGRRPSSTGYIPNDAIDALKVLQQMEAKEAPPTFSSSSGTTASPELPNVMSTPGSRLTQLIKENPKLAEELYKKSLGQDVTVPELPNLK